MKVFLSYTTRDGFISKKLLKLIESEISKECDIYIDLLHNRSPSPQDEVVNQLSSSDMLIQISTPSIDDSNWASLEKSLAIKNNIMTYFVDYFHLRPSQLVSDLIEIVKSNNSSQKDALVCASA